MRAADAAGSHPICCLVYTYRGVGSCNAVKLTPSDLLHDLTRGVGCLGVSHWIGFPVRLSRSLSLSLSRHVHGSKWLLVSYRHGHSNPPRCFHCLPTVVKWQGPGEIEIDVDRS